MLIQRVIVITLATVAFVSMEVRVEAFNIFNRVIWGAPNSDFSSNNFGLITSASSPRQMQLGLKLYW